MERVSAIPRAGAQRVALRPGRCRGRGDRRDVDVLLYAPRRVRVWMVERVDGATRRNGDPKAGARFEVAHGKLEAIARRVPDEPNFIGSAQPVGELAS